MNHEQTKLPSAAKPINVLNTLTSAEIASYIQQGKRELAPCRYCGKELQMRKDQKFCSAKCRVDYSQLAARVALEQLHLDKAAWQKERTELVQEVSRLQKRVWELEAGGARIAYT